jgi:hypothetical protein
MTCNICGCDYHKITHNSYVCSNGHIFLVIDQSIYETSSWSSVLSSQVEIQRWIPQEPLEKKRTPVPQVFYDAFAEEEK